MPMPSTASIKVLLGGRQTVEEFKSDFMGMPFEGRLLQGYDNVTQRYWCVWTDNMSTGCMISYGTETSPGTIEYLGHRPGRPHPQGGVRSAWSWAPLMTAATP